MSLIPHSHLPQGTTNPTHTHTHTHSALWPQTLHVCLPVRREIIRSSYNVHVLQIFSASSAKSDPIRQKNKKKENNLRARVSFGPEGVFTNEKLVRMCAPSTCANTPSASAV